MCVVTQEALHHKFNPCATIESIPYLKRKIN
nr:MAG TPA: DENN domain-containing protein [Caudoviricetes sp.]